VLAVTSGHTLGPGQKGLQRLCQLLKPLLAIDLRKLTHKKSVRKRTPNVRSWYMRGLSFYQHNEGE